MVLPNVTGGSCVSLGFDTTLHCLRGFLAWLRLFDFGAQLSQICKTAEVEGVPGHNWSNLTAQARPPKPTPRPDAFRLYPEMETPLPPLPTCASANQLGWKILSEFQIQNT